MQLCIVSHTVAADLRGIGATMNSLKEKFYCTTVHLDLQYFVPGCIHYFCTIGEGKVPCLFGVLLQGIIAKDLLYLNFWKLAQRWSERSTCWFCKTICQVTRVYTQLGLSPLKMLCLFWFIGVQHLNHQNVWCQMGQHISKMRLFVCLGMGWKFHIISRLHIDLGAMEQWKS